MLRCENEIVRRISSLNVVEILLRFYPAKERVLKYSIDSSKPKHTSLSLPTSPLPLFKSASQPQSSTTTLPDIVVHQVPMELDEETRQLDFSPDGEARGLTTALEIDQDLKVERKSYRMSVIHNERMQRRLSSLSQNSQNGNMQSPAINSEEETKDQLNERIEEIKIEE